MSPPQVLIRKPRSASPYAAAGKLASVVIAWLALFSHSVLADTPRTAKRMPVSRIETRYHVPTSSVWRTEPATRLSKVGIRSESPNGRTSQFVSQTPSGSQLRLVSQIETVPGDPTIESSGSDIAPVELVQPDNPATSTELPRPAATVLNKTLNELTANIEPPAGDFPPNAAPRRTVLHSPASRGWVNSLYQWQAPVLCHQRLYFEEVNLERYGYRAFGPLQPALSGAHFFGSMLALPYNLTSANPCECVYTLSHYRPGSEVPRQIHWPRRSATGAIYEFDTIAGLILLIP